VKYTVGSSATTLYPAAGGSDDWAKGIAGIKYAYTIEMGDTGRYGFVLPAKFIQYNGKDGVTFADTVARAIAQGRDDMMGPKCGELWSRPTRISEWPMNCSPNMVGALFICY